METPKNINWNLLIYLAIAFVIWRFSDRIFSAFGIGEKGEGKEAGDTTEKKGVLDFEKYLAGLKAKTGGKIPTGKKITTLSGKQISGICIDLDKEFKKFNADESKIISYLKQASTKGDIAIIGKVYQSTIKHDLYADLKETLNDEEQKNIFAYINKLPQYV